MRFEAIVGNDEIKEYLLSVSKTGNMSQSYLFVGTEGIGKLLMAKEFAKKVLCLSTEKEKDCECKSCKSFEGLNHPDFYVINEEGDSIKVDQIREMISSVLEAPIVSNKKVYIINDCEKMTVEAQNCLLKTLEEPPEFAIIILICAKENLILNTIKSRCMTIKFKNIPNEKLQKYARDELGYTQMTENLLKSFQGSIGQAIVQKENQDKFLQINQIIEDLSNQDVICIMNEAKVLYDKENIFDFLAYLIVAVYRKSQINQEYLNCIDKINHCEKRLKSNCNFDMCVDTMLFEMWECVRKGIENETNCRDKI